MSGPALRDTLTFEHPLFPKLGEVVFRPAEADGTPVMVVAMGKSTAAVPLGSLQAEMKIEQDSPDGRMFAQIARALDFVAELRPGDMLPVEVLGGGASWQPDPVHERAALARLQLRLIALGEGAAVPDWAVAERPVVLEAAEAPGFAIDLRAALVETAAGLGLPDAASVARLVEQAARELAFVEALRDRLLRRVLQMVDRIEALLPSVSQNLSGLELMTRVLHLAGIALTKMRARFAELDACFGILPGGLQTLDDHRATIQGHRDWLYCSLRGWSSVLASWEAASRELTDATWPLLASTYRFLASRFMPVHEWQLAGRARRPGKADKLRMVW